MKSKKIVMLVSGVCGLALICGVANKSFALITNPVEKRIIEKIEEDRHKSNASELLTKDLCSYINNSEYSKEFRTYCLSVSVKCMDSKTLENLIKELPNGIDWCDYENDNFAYLFYRCASKINDGISESNSKTREFVNNVFNKGIGYLISNSFAPESFKNKSNVYKLGYLKSICTIGSEKLTNLENISISEISQKISKIKCEDLGTNKKVLLTYAKIPGKQQKTEEIKALKAITGDVKSVEDFEKFLNYERKLGKEELGKEVLLQLAKIPHDSKEQLSALKAIIGKRKFGDFLNYERKLGKEELGKEVLLQLARIPHDSEEQLSALKAIIGERKFGDFLNDEKELGKEVLLQLARIPGEQQKTEGIEALKAIIGKREFGEFLNDERKLGKEVLLQLAKIPNDSTEQLLALRAIIRGREFGKFLEDEGNFGGKVLMQLARIPHDSTEQISALEAVYKPKKLRLYYEKQIKTISNNILGNIMKKRSNENSNEDLVFRLNSMIKGSERRGQKKCCSRNQQFVGYNDGYYCVSEDEDKVSGSVNPNGSCNRLRINHRFTKSKSECIKKQDMGMARPRYRKKNDGSLLWSRQK